MLSRNLFERQASNVHMNDIIHSTGGRTMNAIMKSAVVVAGLAFVGGIAISPWAEAQEVKIVERTSEKNAKGWLGVAVRDVTKSAAEKNKLKNRDGALIQDVVKESPADSAGFKEDDIIVEFGGRTIYDSDDLVKAVGRAESGSKVSATVVRDGQKKTLQVTVGTPPKPKKSISAAASPMRIFSTFMGTRTLGMKLIELNEQLAEFLEVPGKEGVLVEEVRKESPAEKAGFKAGDVIVRFGTKSVDEIRDVRRALEFYDENEKVDVEVIRKGQKKTLTVTVPEDSAEEILELPTLPNLPPSPPMHFRHFDGAMENFDVRLERLEPELKEIQIELEQSARALKDAQNKAGKELRRVIDVKRIYEI